MTDPTLDEILAPVRREVSCPGCDGCVEADEPTYYFDLCRGTGRVPEHPHDTVRRLVRIAQVVQPFIEAAQDVGETWDRLLGRGADEPSGLDE